MFCAIGAEVDHLETHHNTVLFLKSRYFVLKLGGSKWNVTQNEILLKREYHSKWNITQNEIPLKMEYHLKWNVTQSRITLKM